MGHTDALEIARRIDYIGNDVAAQAVSEMLKRQVQMDSGRIAGGTGYPQSLANFNLVSDLERRTNRGQMGIP